jgi:NADH:ubiquinone oxidoreductase subunit 6 (subunit J)
VTLEVAAFWAFAVVLVGSALAVVLSKNLFHSVLWLALALTGTAGVFLLLDAEFLAAVQILLYAGGVVTVVVFAIVVTERLVGTRLSQTNRHVVRGALASAVLMALLLSWIRRAPDVARTDWLVPDVTRELGTTLLTRFILPFELLAVLLLVSLIGASYFARPEE